MSTRFAFMCACLQASIVTSFPYVPVCAHSEGVSGCIQAVQFPSKAREWNGMGRWHCCPAALPEGGQGAGEVQEHQRHVRPALAERLRDGVRGDVQPGGEVGVEVVGEGGGRRRTPAGGLPRWRAVGRGAALCRGVWSGGWPLVDVRLATSLLRLENKSKFRF